MALTEASPTNRIVLNSSGRCRITLAGTVIAGDALGFSTGWKRALATVGTAIDTELVALEDGISGDVIEAAACAELGGFSSATPGNPLYQAEGTKNGEYTETEPTDTNDVNTIIGRILSATTILVKPSVRAGTVHA